MMETWLCFKVKRRSSFPSPWRVLMMLISSTHRSHSLPPKQIALSLHFEIGWDVMATANPNGLAPAPTNLSLQQFYQNGRYNNLQPLPFLITTSPRGHPLKQNGLFLHFYFRCWIDLSNTLWNAHHAKEPMKHFRDGKSFSSVQLWYAVRQLGFPQRSNSG